jgi:hypothetical protein
MPHAPVSARHALSVHSASQAGAVGALDVTLSRPDPGELQLAYTVSGDIAQLRLPEPRPPVRADGLWRHTCFEAFVRRRGGAEYWEYNLSPSGAWAAYHFTGYREGMAPLLKGAPPQISLEAAADSITLTARIDIGWLARAAGDTPLEAALAAVIDDKAHVLSYWALAHPAEKPDFHHAGSFVVALD